MVGIRHSRRLQAAGQRGLDHSQITPAVERFAGKENRAAVRACERGLCRACFKHGVRIGSARESILCPVDRPCRDNVSRQLLRREPENFAERGEPCFDQFAFVNASQAFRPGTSEPARQHGMLSRMLRPPNRNRLVR